MAGTIKGITVEIGGNTTGLSAALKEPEDKARALTNELRAVEKALKLDPSNVTLLAEKQRILNEQVANTSEKLKVLEQSQKEVNEQFKSGKITEDAYKAFNLELGKTQAELTNTEKKLDDLNDSSNKTDKGVVDLTKSVKNSGDTADKSGERFKAMGVIVADVAKIAATATATIAAAAGAMAVKLGTEVVSAFANYEQLVGGVETLFKDSSAIVQGYAENAFKTAGMSANEYMETVTGFSASLIQSLEGDTAKASQVADMAITDMFDNANKMGSDISSIQNAYQGFAKQNYTMLDNLKLGYGGTKAEMERLLADAEKISGIKYDLSSFADLTEAIHVIQTEMGITGTTAKEASETISGSMSAMGSAIKNMMSGLGNVDADIDLLTSNVVEAFQNVVKNVTPIIQNLVSVLPTAINTIVPSIGDMLPTLLDAAKDLFTQMLTTVVTMIPELIPEILDATTAMIDTLIGLLMPKFTGLGDMISGVIGGAVNTLSGVLGFLIERFDAVVTVLAIATSAFAAYKAAVAITSVIQSVTAALNGMTIAQYALNLAQSLSPVGLVVAGFAALTAGAIALGVAFSQPRDEIQALIGETNNLNNAVEETIDKIKKSRDAFNDTSKAIDTEAESTTKLADRLNELTEQEELTNVEKTELKHIVDQLNTALPALGLSIDGVSGKVQGYTGNIYDLIEAKRQLAVYEGAEIRYIEALNTKDILKEQVEDVKEQRTIIENAIKDMEAANPRLKIATSGLLTNERSEYNKLKKSLDEINGSYKDLVKQQGANRQEIADSQAVIDEYAKTLEPLPEIIEDAGDSTDEATKSTIDYTKALKSNSNEVKQSEAEQKKIEATYQGNANSVEALTAKIGGLNNTYSANQERIALLKKAISDETAALDENADSYDENVSKIQAYQTELTNTETAQITLGREIQTMSGYLDEAANSSDGFATTIDGTGKLVKDISASTTAAIAKDAKAIEKATKDAAKESAKAIEETVKPIDEAFKSIEKSAESLIKSYESTRDAAKNSFQSQLDYFRESAEGTELTAKNILDSMTTFTGEAIGYNEDLQRATELGFTDGFVATLTDGGKESKQVLKTILDEYDKLTDGLSADDAKAFVDDFNWAFGQTHKATDALAETVAEMKTGFSDKAQEMLQIASDFGDNLSQYTGEAFDELKNRVDKVMTDLSALIKPKGEKTVEELKSGIEEKTPDAIEVSETLAAGIIEPIEALEEKAYTSGGNFVKGYMSGVQAEIAKAKASGTDVAEASLEGLREGLDEHSPSRETYKSGENTVLGYVGGVDDNIWRIDDVMDRMTRSVVSSLTSTNEIIATSQEALVDYYNAMTRFEKIDLSQFQGIFKDFSAFQDITETSMQTLDSLVNNIGLDLSTATSEIQRFKDSVYGLDREIITIRDAYGNVFQAGNMPGYMPDPNNPGMAIVNEEYWKEAERIDRLWYNNLDIEEIEKAAEETNIIIRDAMINAVDMEEWGKYVAQMAAEGFTVALPDEMGNVIDAVEYFTNGIKKTVETELDIHSPSGFTEWVADMFNAGFINNIRAGIGKTVSAIRDVTSAVKSEFSMIPAAVGVNATVGGGIDGDGISISDKLRAAQNYTYNTSNNNMTNSNEFNQTNHFTSTPTINDYEKIKQAGRMAKELMKNVIK